MLKIKKDKTTYSYKISKEKLEPEPGFGPPDFQPGALPLELIVRKPSF